MIINNVPSKIYNMKVMKLIYEVQQSKVDEINANIDDIRNQCYIDTATWGLVYWEGEYGIKTILTDSYEIRRSRVKSKMRGFGTVTVAMLKNVAASYACGEINVIEDVPNYTFTIKFTSLIGIPPNLNDFKAIIEEIKPAFLIPKYEFTYMTWNDYEKYNKTLDEWDSLHLTCDEFQVYKE
jgi:hypothetical protein